MAVQLRERNGLDLPGEAAVRLISPLLKPSVLAVGVATLITACHTAEKGGADSSQQETITDATELVEGWPGADEVQDEPGSLNGDHGVDAATDPCSGPNKPARCPCVKNDECGIPMCLDGECPQSCVSEDECRDDEYCGMFPGMDVLFVCWPFFHHLCHPCTQKHQCGPSGAGLCQPIGGEDGFCVVACLEGTCPEGYQCLGDGYCFPVSGTCPCSHIETCNGLDDDCDGDTDEWGAEGCSLYYPDMDGDGHGWSKGINCWCPPGPDPEQYSPVAGDCDDWNPDVHPGAAEDCSTTLDEDCDGLLNQQGAEGCTVYYEDQDRDGYGVEPGQCWCQPPSTTMTATQAGDCDDHDASVPTESGCE